jgi:ABC-2 type transport system ATP-binding protein
MININNITKTFDGFTALDSVNMSVNTGSIFGLVGSNGAGKSTLMRIMSGVYAADGGQITIDGQDIKNNPSARKNLVYVPDDLYFLPGANMDRMAKLCKNTRAQFDEKKYQELADKFEASRTKSINSMSKGMKRQAALILALASNPDILLIDETFDGLDVIKRHGMRNEMCAAVAERGLTVIMATHSMREVDDMCDSIAMLHKGKITVQSELDDAKTALVKVQIAFNSDFGQSEVEFEGAKIVSFNKDGAVATVIYENERKTVEYELSAKNPVLINVLPLSLEEVFIYRCQ